ncbi:MAG TPA: Crp/Fnr family transcriptional regulator [Rhizomicrobium sp.]|jgi:CRP-like cAMP-binding protein|nr:Crp/Fnr family transcriptional regulator [Rhizomicrobium sp.]
MKSPSPSRSKLRLPEMRARPFDRKTDAPSRIENLLPRRQQARLQAIATVLDYQRGNNTIFSEGEDAHFIYAVTAGVVRISRYTESGRRQILALMLPGDVFGIPEAGIYVNSAETVCPATLYRVPWQRLHEMMLEEPEMQVSLLMRVAFDLRQAQRRIVMLGQHNIIQRLASFLLELSQHPDFYNRRSRRLEVPLSRPDLGDYLGAAAETVARALSSLERTRVIRRISPRVLEIPDIDRLRQITSDKRRRTGPEISRKRT